MKTQSELAQIVTEKQNAVNVLDKEFNGLMDKGSMNKAKAVAPKLAAARAELIAAKRELEQHPETRRANNRAFANVLIDAMEGVYFNSQKAAVLRSKF